MTQMTVTSVGEVMRDMYALPGTRLKQWVVDARREAAWERETCPIVDIAEHEDNTGARCRNEGPTRWASLDHDCCSTCGDLHAMTMLRHDIAVWIILRDARPKLCADHSLYSDEIEPESPLMTHPLLPRGTMTSRYKP